MQTETPTSETLPRWDMTPIFPSLSALEFTTEFESALDSIGEMSAQFEQIGVRRRDDSGVDAKFVQNFETVIVSLNDLLQRLNTLGSYIGCFVTTDAGDELAKARESEMETRAIVLGQLETRLVAWVGSSDIEALFNQSQIARDHEFWVRRAAQLAAHQMSAAEEDLAASLQPMGLGGWAKLHGNMTALLSVPVQIEGENKLLPMSTIRALSNDSSRATREAAYVAEIASWQTVAMPLAGALNGIKGFQREVRARRGYTDDVEPTLIGNSIDAATLKAMQDACAASFPDFRRYMKAKARALNLEKLEWFDLGAPVGKSNSEWSWAASQQFLSENFGVYSPRMAQFSDRAYDENWMDAPPRMGKIGGAYCTGTRPGESRILTNFDGSYNAVSTVAHELGHGYHNLCLENRTPLQSEIPMTLAETASIFCETLALQAAIKDAAPQERIALLDNSLSGSLQVVIDIHSRFLFESSVFVKREARELTESEFCALMLDAQHQTYGEDMASYHPYMWAVKGHYYGPRFYNYPYTFGLLFALGLYAIYQSEPETFRARYDEFLSECGMADAKTLAAKFGIDVTTPEFWTASLDVIRAQIDEFESLV